MHTRLRHVRRRGLHHRPAAPVAVAQLVLLGRHKNSGASGLHHRASVERAARLRCARAASGAQPGLHRRVSTQQRRLYRLDTWRARRDSARGAALPVADVVSGPTSSSPPLPKRRRAAMRHASRVAAAAAAARPQRALGQAAALATHAPTVVHPPDQSVRPGYTKDDPSHTSKWLQVRRAERGARTARFADARAICSRRRRPRARRRTGSPACPLRRSSRATSRAASGVRAPARHPCFKRAPIDAFAARRPGTDPALGHPVEYIVLNDTSAEFPAVCKYCGLRYHMTAHAH